MKTAIEDIATADVQARRLTVATRRSSKAASEAESESTQDPLSGMDTETDTDRDTVLRKAGTKQEPKKAGPCWRMGKAGAEERRASKDTVSDPDEPVKVPWYKKIKGLALLIATDFDERIC
jgi:hypothetical protein